MGEPQRFGIAGATVAPLRFGRSAIVSRNLNANLSFGPNTNSPIQVFVVRDGAYVDVTRRAPRLVRADAAHWWSIISQYPSVTGGLPDAGPVAAWAADEYMLGHRPHADRVIERLAADPGLAGPGGPVSAAYIEQYLAQQGY